MDSVGAKWGLASYKSGFLSEAKLVWAGTVIELRSITRDGQ